MLARLGETLDEVFASIDETRDRLFALYGEARARGQQLRRADLEGLRPLLERHLACHRDLLAGTGVVCARDLLQDSPRWLEWWCTAPDEVVRFLDVTLDPRDPSYYEYERAEWFTRPRENGGRSIAGPFVDYSATNQHILTLTVPIVADGAFLGVAGADIDLSSLENVVLPLLCALDHEAAIVNQNGRIVASNSPRLPDGIRLSATDVAWLQMSAATVPSVRMARCSPAPPARRSA